MGTYIYDRTFEVNLVAFQLGTKKNTVNKYEREEQEEKLLCDCIIPSEVPIPYTFRVAKILGVELPHL